MNMMIKAIVPDDAWAGFKQGPWQTSVDVRDFIQTNYTPYSGDSTFLSGPTERTKSLWDELTKLLEAERAKGVLDVSADRASSITAHDAGYINRYKEIIVGLQTDAPLKRAIMPNGGLRMVEAGLESMASRSTKASARFGRTTARATIRVCSTSIRPTSWPRANRAL